MATELMDPPTPERYGGRAPTHEVEAVGSIVWRILSWKEVGRENAMERKALLARVRLYAPTLGDRTLRLAIRHLRTEEKRPIAPALSAPWGYYVMRPSERNDLRNAILKRIRSEAELLAITDTEAAERIMEMLSREGLEEVQGRLW